MLLPEQMKAFPIVNHTITHKQEGIKNMEEKKFRDMKHHLDEAEITAILNEYHNDLETELSFVEWVGEKHPDIFENTPGYRDWCKWIKVESFVYDDDNDDIDFDDFSESDESNEDDDQEDNHDEE